MQNLAYKIEPTMNDSDSCAACGESLFGPRASSGTWQTWSAFWEIMGTSNVDLVCGGCGEYLQEIFNNRA